MALTESYMLPLGRLAPDFSLLNVVTGKQCTLESLKGSKGTLIIFMCNHCPFVIHVNTALVQIANEYQAKGIQFIAVSSNEIENYPEEEEKIELFKNDQMVLDSQEVAQAYDNTKGALYVFWQNKLMYRGRYDASRPQSGTPITGEDLKSAALNLINKKPISENQFPSMGCNIKWK